MGKVIGGGLPVGAYGGKKEIMQMVAPAGPMYQASRGRRVQRGDVPTLGSASRPCCAGRPGSRQWQSRANSGGC